MKIPLDLYLVIVKKLFDGLEMKDVVKAVKSHFSYEKDEIVKLFNIRNNYLKALNSKMELSLLFQIF
jgi:hypothetical protein